jgi:hypothetical protein
MSNPSSTVGATPTAKSVAPVSTEITLAQRLNALEARIAALEADRDRFLGALRGAAEMCLQNTLVVSMLPKKMKEDLRAYLNAPH